MASLDQFRRLKTDLYQSFVTSNSRGFTDQQVDLAKQCISLARSRLGLSGADTYDCIPFVRILKDNELIYTKINVALNLVLQYITNLLTDDLPPNWWSISTKTAAYAFRLARVSGAEDLLRQAGYTKKSGDFLSFPEDKRTIDKGHLSRLATEVLLARVDCEGMIDKRWEPPSEVSGTSPASLSSAHTTSPSMSRNRGPHPSYTQPVLPPSYGTGRDRPPSTGSSGGYTPPALPPSYGAGHDRPPSTGSSGGYTPPALPPSYHTDQDSMQSLDQTPRPRYPRHEGPNNRERYPANNEPSRRGDYNPPLRPSDNFSSRPEHRGSGYDDRGSHPNRGSDFGSRGSGYDNRGSEYDRRGPDHSNMGSGNNDSSRGHDASSGHYPPPSNHSNHPQSSSEENRPQPAPRLPRQSLPSQLKPNQDVSGSLGFHHMQSTESEHSSYTPSADSFTRQPEPRPRPEPSTDRFSGSRMHEDPPTHSSNLRPSSSESSEPPFQRRSEEQPVRSSSRTSGELSGGSHHSSPSNSGPHSSNNSGSQMGSLGMGPSPDDPGSKPSAKNARTTKFLQILEMAEEIRKEAAEDPLAKNPHHTTPVNQASQPPAPFGTSLATPPQRSSSDDPTPKPRPRKARTSASPAGPPSRVDGGFGQRRNLLSGLSEEEQHPGPPICPKCKAVLKDGPCLYCAGQSGPPVGPPPRKLPDDNPPMSFSQRPREPEREPQPAAKALPPPFESLSTMERKRQEQLDEEGARFMERNRDKNYAEVQHFKSLNLPQQQDYLDDKVKNKESYGHLKPHWRGRTPYKEKEQEVHWFESLSGAQQQGFLQDKIEDGLDVSRFQHSLKSGVSLDTQDIQNTSAFPSDIVEIEARREKVRKDGEHFVHWLRECGRYGFHPKEVEVAIDKHPRNPLDYLQKQWLHLVSRFIEMVDLYMDKYNHRYGKPSENEARLFLIEGKGDINKSTKLCINDRRKKIKQLQDKINNRFEVSRDTIVNVLCRCDMVVDEAYYSLQRDALSELYTYMTTEYSEITEGVAEMEFLKKSVVARMESDDEVKTQACIRMIMAECKFKTLAKARILFQLLKDGNEYPLKYYIDASNNYNTYEEAQKYLNQSCPICMMDYPMDEMVVMPACGEAICRDCFMTHFTLVIKEQSVKHFTCPLCNEPDLSSPDQTQTMNLELFVGMVKAHLDEKVYQMCQQKLTDFNLSKDEGFVWCPHENCRCGFINDNKDRYDIQCVHCRQRMCFQCKRPWEEQHKGLTCEQFAKWKADNDPEAQKAGLAAHLNENGIQCPQCKFRYALARGGCMHFRCTQCPNEFCSGCGGSIKQGDKCGRFESCKKFGLHAHHPRDCLFYLRDFSVPQLQQILNKNEIEFDTEPSKAQVEATRDRLKEEQNQGQPLQEQVVLEDIEGEEPVAEQPEAEALPEDIKLTCCVMLQKELPEGLKDEECGKDALKGMAGLCETHYKEYLVSKINNNALDPIELYELHQLKRMLEREEMEVPPQNEEEDETNDDYKLRLIEHIRKVLPLDRNNAPELAQ